MTAMHIKQAIAVYISRKLAYGLVFLRLQLFILFYFEDKLAPHFVLLVY